MYYIGIYVCVYISLDVHTYICIYDTYIWHFDNKIDVKFGWPVKCDYGIKRKFFACREVSKIH